MTVKEFTFTDEEVEAWCERNDDPNPLHLDADVAMQSSFGQRIVPGMLLLNKLSGMVADLGDEDEEVILSGVTAARFRDPVLLNETVNFSLFDVEEGENYTTVEFEIRVPTRGSLAANGALTIVIN